VQTLATGNYIAIGRGLGATIGVCLIEVYDLDTGSSSQLTDRSTRGPFGTSDNVMIAGIVVGRATRGGSRSERSGLPWLSSACQTCCTIRPLTWLPRRTFGADRRLVRRTATMRGKRDATGNALVEVYELP